MASVERWTPDPKTGKPRWRAHWRNDKGKPQSKVCGTEGAATRLGVRMEAAKLDGTYVDLAAGKTKFRRYGDEWLSVQIIEESTRESVESRLRTHVWPVLGDLPLHRIKPSTIQSWLKGLSCADSTAKVIFGHVSAILTSAVDDRAIPTNPCLAKSVKRPKPTTEKAQPFTADEVDAIIDDHASMYRAIPVLATGLGLRQGECFGLTQSDVDFLGRWVYVRRQVKIVRGKIVLGLPKGRKKRRVPLPDWVGFALSEHLRSHGAIDFPDLVIEKDARDKPVTNNPGGFLFRNTIGNPINRVTYNGYVWKPALKAAGVDETDNRNGMHRCRHTFASALLAEGESIAAVSEWLGHADPSITLRIYAHLMPKSENQTRNLIDRAFGSDRCTEVAQQRQERG